MDRAAVFVDAGSILIAGGMHFCGSQADREVIGCDYSAVVTALKQFAENHSGLSVLRVYWYDAAPDAVPQGDHTVIANLPFVKLRLGHMRGGRQKGVDSRIVRDLMVLSRERAITKAYLVGGDEDLREGVVEAQDMGVQVILLNLPATPRTTPSPLMEWEADESITLELDMLRPFFWQIPRAGTPAAATPPGGPAPGPAPVPPGAAPAPPQTLPSVEFVETLGREFARIWASRVTTDEISALSRDAPFLPPQIDRQLVFFAQRQAGSLRDKGHLRRLLRQAFHNTLRGIAEALEAPEAPEVPEAPP